MVYDSDVSCCFGSVLLYCTADIKILGVIILQQFQINTHLFLRGIDSLRNGVLAAPCVIPKYSAEGC